MAHTKITIDGDTILDANLSSDWQGKLPDQIQAYLRPDAKPEPWRMALIHEFTQSVLAGRPLTVTVTTRDTGYTLDIDHQ